MSTDIRPEISTKKKYWIEKERYYELKHFCLQYNDWMKCIDSVSLIQAAKLKLGSPEYNEFEGSRTEKCAQLREYYRQKAALVEEAARLTDPCLGTYIMIGVVNGYSYDEIKARMDVPCSKDVYYDYYRKFFYILSWLRK